MRYLISLFGGLILLSCLWVWLFFNQLGVATESSAWTHELVKQKSLAAHAMAGPRLIIVAGSSAHFGVNAEAMSKALGIHTVNFGTFAALNVEYLLAKTKEIVRAGDTVLLALEYAYFKHEPQYTLHYVDYIIARDPAYFYSLSIIEQLKIFAAIPFKRLLTPLRDARMKRPPASLNVYSYYDHPYGDTHSNARVFATATTRTAKATLVPDAGFITVSEQSRTWNILQSFAKWSQDHGVKLMATAPNHMHFDELDNDAIRANVKRIVDFYTANDIPFIGDPFDATIDKSFYLDTVYHPNDLGKFLYTQQLIHHLKVVLPPQTSPYQPLMNSADNNPVDAILDKFNGWEAIQGLQAFAVPDPAVAFPGTVGAEPELTLKLYSLANETVKLSAEFRPCFDKQRVSIVVDGNVIWQNQYNHQQDFQRLTLAIPLIAGEHFLQINSDIDGSPRCNADNIALLFNSLLVSTN